MIRGPLIFLLLGRARFPRLWERHAWLDAKIWVRPKWASLLWRLRPEQGCSGATAQTRVSVPPASV